MITTLNSCCILAQFSKWERLGDGFRRSGPPLQLADVLPYLLGLLLIGGFVAALVIYRRRNDLSQPCSDSQKLFRELCLAHDLDRGAQKLLGQLADAFQLAQPAEVFVRPSVFSQDRMPDHLQSQAAHIAALRERLF